MQSFDPPLQPLIFYAKYQHNCVFLFFTLQGPYSSTSCFPRSLCGCVSQTPTVLMQASHMWRRSKPLPSFSHTNCNYVIRFTNNQHTEPLIIFLLGLTVILSKLSILERRFSLTTINSDSIKVSYNHSLSSKCLSCRDMQWEQEEHH